MRRAFWLCRSTTPLGSPDLRVRQRPLPQSAALAGCFVGREPRGRRWALPLAGPHSRTAFQRANPLSHAAARFLFHPCAAEVVTICPYVTGAELKTWKIVPAKEEHFHFFSAPAVTSRPQWRGLARAQRHPAVEALQLGSAKSATTRLDLGKACGRQRSESGSDRCQPSSPQATCRLSASGRVSQSGRGGAGRGGAGGD